MKFYRFKSVQILVSFISLNFFCLILVYFAAKLALFLICSEILSKNEPRVLENHSYKRSVLQFLSTGTT